MPGCTGKAAREGRALAQDGQFLAVLAPEVSSEPVQSNGQPSFVVDHAIGCLEQVCGFGSRISNVVFMVSWIGSSP